MATCLWKEQPTCTVNQFVSSVDNRLMSKTREVLQNLLGKTNYDFIVCLKCTVHYTYAKKKSEPTQRTIAVQCVDLSPFLWLLIVYLFTQSCRKGTMVLINTKERVKETKLLKSSHVTVGIITTVWSTLNFEIYYLCYFNTLSYVMALDTQIRKRPGLIPDMR